jgi:hypothetical protein
MILASRPIRTLQLRQECRRQTLEVVARSLIGERLGPSRSSAHGGLRVSSAAGHIGDDEHRRRGGRSSRGDGRTGSSFSDRRSVLRSARRAAAPRRRNWYVAPAPEKCGDRSASARTLRSITLRRPARSCRTGLAYAARSHIHTRCVRFGCLLRMPLDSGRAVVNQRCRRATTMISGDDSDAGLRSQSP